MLFQRDVCLYFLFDILNFGLVPWCIRIDMDLQDCFIGYIRYTTETQKNRNKYSQKRNCAPQSQHIHVSVSDLYIPMIGLLILLQENM
jgi:hypothetical protein